MFFEHKSHFFTYISHFLHLGYFKTNYIYTNKLSLNQSYIETIKFNFYEKTIY